MIIMRDPKELIEMAKTQGGMISAGNIQQFYDMKAGELPNADREYKNPSYRYEWILKKIDHSKPLRILDIGCGNGVLAKLLKEKGHQVDVLDISKVVVSNAITYSGAAGIVHNICDSIEEELFGTYDICVALEVLEHLEQPDKAVQNIMKLLKKDGMFLGTVPEGTNLYVPEHIQIFDFYQLVDLFEGYSTKICNIPKMDVRDKKILFAFEVKNDRRE